MQLTALLDAVGPEEGVQFDLAMPCRVFDAELWFAESPADVERAKAVGRRIRTGTLMINGGIYYGADVPFGGYRQSGLGREMGVLGFEEYLETKAFAEPA